MICHRCRGLCVSDTVREDGRTTFVKRCINCGSVLDSTIVKNRLLPLKGLFPKFHKKRAIQTSGRRAVKLQEVCA